MTKKKFKEFEVTGVIEVPKSLTEDEFFNEFIGFMESRGWSFGGGIRGHYGEDDDLNVVCPFCDREHKRHNESMNVVCNCGATYHAARRFWTDYAEDGRHYTMVRSGV